MEWDEFLQRVSVQLQRLGITERDARFMGFDEPNEAFLSELSCLPDNVGPAGFYAHFGADLAELQRRESEWEGSSPTDA